MKKTIIGILIVAAIVAAAAGFVVCLNPFECSKNVTVSVNDVELSGISVMNGTVEVPNDVNFKQETDDDGCVWNVNTGDEKLEVAVFHSDEKALIDETYKHAIETNSRDSQLKEIDNHDFNNAHVYEVKGDCKYVVIFESGNEIIKIRCDNLDTAKMIFNSIKVDVPAKEQTTTETTTESTNTNDYSLKTYEINGKNYQAHNLMEADDQAYHEQQAKK